MGLIPAFRGIGIGRRIIEATLAVAWAAALKRVQFDVHSDNLAATRLYEKIRFVREGMVQNARLIDGLYRDAIAMAIGRP